MLLAHRASPTTKNAAGKGPLDIAAEKGHQDVVQLLQGAMITPREAVYKGRSSFVIQGDNKLVAQSRTGSVITRREFLTLLRTDKDFRGDLHQSLRALATKAAGAGNPVSWECAPFSPVLLDTPWECVMLKPPYPPAGAFGKLGYGALTRGIIDGSAFATGSNMYLKTKPGSSVAFHTLNSSTRRLVVPRRKRGLPSDRRYYHIGTWLQEADADECEALWQLVADEAWTKVDAAQTFWLSTDGFSVAWLHVRLDEGPYIRHPDYKP